MVKSTLQILLASEGETHLFIESACRKIAGHYVNTDTLVASFLCSVDTKLDHSLPYPLTIAFVKDCKGVYDHIFSLGDSFFPVPY